MRLDGTNKRQITRLGVMSWAPYCHPSGDHIVFANNAQGYSNFELYLVDAVVAMEQPSLCPSGRCWRMSSGCNRGGRRWRAARSSTISLTT